VQAVVIQKFKKLLLGISLFACALCLHANEERGVGLRFYMNHKTEASLVNFFWNQRESLGESLWIEKYPAAEVDFSDIGCAVMVWKPMLGHSQHDENRIHCNVGFTWFEGSEKKYGKSRIVYMLGSEIIKADAFSENPSFSFYGKAANALFETLKKVNDEGLSANIAKAKSYEDKDLYYFTSSDETNAMLFCQSSNEKALCSFTWPKVFVSETRLDVGENADVFLKALCKYGIKPDRGECPTPFSKPINVEGDYVGVSVPVGTWGAVTDSAYFEFSYLDAGVKKTVQFNLSSLVVRPHGGRYSSTIGIDLKGPRVGRIYRALKSYAESNMRGDSIIDEKSPVSLMSLGGRPPWDMTYVSLRRATNPDEALVSLSCEARTVSEDAFYFTPEKYDTGFTQYSCTLSRPFLRPR